MQFLLLTIFIIYGEWKLKNYIEGTKKDDQESFLFHKKIRVRKYHNKGAFLNILEHKRSFLAVISVLFTLVICVFFIGTLFRKGNGLLKLGLSLLLGGAFSNTYDRLTRKYVVDYFSFCTPFVCLNKIVFNLSDFCILIGSLIVVFMQA